MQGGSAWLQEKLNFSGSKLEQLQVAFETVAV